MQQQQQGPQLYPSLNRQEDNNYNNNMAAVQLQQQVQLPPEGPPQEMIPLRDRDFNRSVSETPERVRLRRIFNQVDTDRDGYLTVSEVRRLLRNNQCSEMPRGVTRHILQMADENGDGRLDFEEFCQMSQEHDWVIKGYVQKYCRWIVPNPHREMVDATPDQIDGQYERSMTFCPPPLTMIVFSLLEIIAFIVDVIHLKEDLKDVNAIGHTTRGPAASLFIYNPYRRAEAWRFATYMFVHIGVMHLLMNLIVQIFLGVALELVHCWWRVAMIYVAGVVAGSMGVSLVSPQVFLAGASGGVYALITAHIATIILNFREMEYALIQLFVFLCYIVIDIGSVLYRYFLQQHDQVSYMSHFCGALAGLLVGIGVLKNLKVRRWERWLWWFAVTVYILLMGSGICIHVFLTDYFPKQQVRDMFA